MNSIRDIEIPTRPEMDSFDNFTQYALLYVGGMIRQEVRRRQFDRAGARLVDPTELGECRALLNLESEMWDRANWQPEELAKTAENGVPE